MGWISGIQKQEGAILSVVCRFHTPRGAEFPTLRKEVAVLVRQTRPPGPRRGGRDGTGTSLALPSRDRVGPSGAKPHESLETGGLRSPRILLDLKWGAKNMYLFSGILQSTLQGEGKCAGTLNFYCEKIMLFFRGRRLFAILLVTLWKPNQFLVIKKLVWSQLL